MRQVFTKKNITGILLSVIASIIFVRLVDPLMDVLGMIGTQIAGEFVNKYYVVCANATDYQFTGFIAYMVFILGITNAWNTFKYFAFPKKEMPAKKEPEPICEEITEEADLSTIKNEITKITARIQELKNYKEKQQKQQKQRVIISRIMLVATFLCFILIIIFVYSPTIVKGSFDRKIIQITPYVTEERINLLKSDWVSMKSKADFKEISEYIDSVLVENGLK